MTPLLPYRVGENATLPTKKFSKKKKSEIDMKSRNISAKKLKIESSSKKKFTENMSSSLE